MKRFIFFAAILVPSWLYALTVQVSTYPNYCSTPGSACANASGGVPPYTYLWNTAETTNCIQSLGGLYSVTVTDFVGTQVVGQDYVLYFDSYPLVTQVGGSRAYCDVIGDPDITPAVVDITLMNESYQFNPSLPLDFSPLLFEPFVDGLYNYVLVANAGVPGSQVLLDYVDAGGCPGSVAVTYGYLVSFPTLGLLNVDGTCGANTGSITVAASVEGHAQWVDLELKNASGQVITRRTIGNVPSTQVFTALAAGDYWLVQRIPRMGGGFLGNYLRGLCGDSLMVTVPDLGPGCGTVIGMVYMDYNVDCVMGNSSETRVPGAILEFTPGPFYATANASGAYSIILSSGAYTVQQIAADIAQHCPAPPAAITVTGVHSLNIADTALVPLDAQLMLANGPARPGFVLSYSIAQSNLTPASTGTTSTTFTFDPAVSYISASPSPNTVNGNVLTWDQSALGAFQERSMHVLLQVPPDVGLIGTVLAASASITTSNTDAVPANNSASTDATVTASFDPNDKSASTSSRASSDLYYIDVDQWIDYTIRFQNTGTDTAFTVIITDTLPGTLDPASIQWGAHSHACTRSLIGQGVLRFTFPFILLPDSNVNEAASHGFVSFRIKPREPVILGTTIENIANIYFDFNDPVITEPSVLVAEFSTSINALSNDALLIAPNPANDRLVVTAPSGVIASVRILTMDGREIIHSISRSSSTPIDLSSLSAGPYVLIATLVDGSKQTARIIKH